MKLFHKHKWIAKDTLYPVIVWLSSVEEGTNIAFECIFCHEWRHEERVGKWEIWRGIPVRRGGETHDHTVRLPKRPASKNGGTARKLPAR